MPRTLAATVRRFISHKSRARGESYFRHGRVATVRADATNFSAVVRGTNRYDVSLTLDEHRLVVVCTCPYFQDSIEPCKHIWAAILAADDARVFQVTSDLWLDFYDDQIADTELEDPGEEYLEEDSTPARSPKADRTGVRSFTNEQRSAISERMTQYWSDRRRGVPPSRPAPVPAPPPAWQTFLSHVALPSADPLPARALLTGELIYVFDPARSASAGGLSIELMTRDRKKSGDWAKPKTLTINRRDIARLPDDRDRRILDAVCGAEPADAYSGPGWGGYGGGMPVPSAFVLNPTLQRELAPRLCETGRLLLRVAPSPADMRAEPSFVPIEWDPELAEFQVRITGNTELGYTIGGAIGSGGREHGLQDVMFVTGALILRAQPDGRPRFAAFETGGADRWMARLLDTGPVTVPAAEVGKRGIGRPASSGFKTTALRCFSSA